MPLVDDDSCPLRNEGNTIPLYEVGASKQVTKAKDDI